VKHEYVLSKQLLRCGTSIGANFTEALHGISTSDFLAKIYISLKECAETKYWLEILYRTDFLTREQYNSINDDCIELIKLLTAITKTTNKNKSKNVAR
jgi:four helix bundle protein